MPRLLLALSLLVAGSAFAEEPVAFMADDMVLNEGDGETINRAFVITLSHEVEHATVMVRLLFADGRVIAPSVTYDLSPGMRQIVYPFSVRGNTSVDGDRVYTLQVIATGVGYFRSTTKLTLFDDDASLQSSPLLIAAGKSENAVVSFGHTLPANVSATISAPPQLEVPQSVAIGAHDLNRFVFAVKGLVPGAYDVTITLPPELFSRVLTQKVIVGNAPFVWPERLTVTAGSWSPLYVFGFSTTGITVRDLSIASTVTNPPIPQPPLLTARPAGGGTAWIYGKKPGLTTATVVFENGRSVDVIIEVVPQPARSRPARR
jgi:hypothetical protein